MIKIDVTDDMARAFERGTIKTDHGLEWKSKRSDGYGMCSWSTKGFSIQVRPHRIAWMLVNGPIPEGFDIDHDPSCPKTCVTVEHLQALSRSDHLKLGWERGQMNGGWGTKREIIHPKKPPAFIWQVKLNCNNCDKIFTPKTSNQVYCDASCRIENKENRRNKKRHPRPELINCDWCGKEFIPKRIDSKLCPRPAKCIDSSQNTKKKARKLI